MHRLTSIVNNRASSSYNHIYILPPQLGKNVQPLPHDLNVFNARCKRLLIAGTIRLVVVIGLKRTFVNNYVVKTFSTSEGKDTERNVFWKRD